MSDKFSFHVVGNNTSVVNMMLAQGFVNKPDYYRNRDSHPDLVIFTGGADLTPFLYGEVPILGERGEKIVNYSPSRDQEEIKLLRSLPYGVGKIGICRGAQLLNVHSGGRLWQDVNNHLSEHEITIDRGKGKRSTIRVSSTHHQMMRPSEEGSVLAWSSESRLKKAEGVSRALSGNHEEDPEVIYYWTTNSLCFQPHPEYGPKDCHDYFMELVRDYMLPQKKTEGK